MHSRQGVEKSTNNQNAQTGKFTVKIHLNRGSHKVCSTNGKLNVCSEF